MEVDSVNLPTPDGRRGILPNHMPIMLPIDIGILFVVEKGRRKKYTVTEGMFYFENNEATLLTGTVEDVELIDIARARAAQARAEERLKNSQSEYEIRRASIALRKAINRIDAAEID